jgi:hypothetical protein
MRSRFRQPVEALLHLDLGVLCNTDARTKPGNICCWRGKMAQGDSLARALPRFVRQFALLLLGTAFEESLAHAGRCWVT